ncbi:MAG: hypothetical protein ABR586_07855 [Thermoplasmatota archaeon]
MRTRSLFVSGTVVAIAFAALIVVGVLIVGLYKSREAGLPPVSATFQRIDAPPANATVHDLDFRAVHTRDSFLEDHLGTAVQQGASQELNRLRVEQMRATLRDLTGVPDSTLFVAWQGAVVQVDFSGFA